MIRRLFLPCLSINEEAIAVPATRKKKTAVRKTETNNFVSLQHTNYRVLGSAVKKIDFELIDYVKLILTKSELNVK